MLMTKCVINLILKYEIVIKNSAKLLFTDQFTPV